MAGVTDISDRPAACANGAPPTAAGHSAQPLLDVRGLSLAFETFDGELQVVRDISFAVAAGERVGIVGESGCGKTVTGLSLLRLLPTRTARLSGEILFKGQDLARLSEQKMRAVRGR